MPKPLILTKRQAEVLDAICELGQTDLVAQKLGITMKAVEVIIGRMMRVNKYPNRLLIALAYDREKRKC